MKHKNLVLYPILTVIAVCLLKIAFFSEATRQVEIIPAAQAQSSISQWDKNSRMISTAENGGMIYVWDFSRKTHVRKYYIEDNKLMMKSYYLDEK
ncbi:MAG: hypothetical protein ABIA63_11390 [bacterium]